MSGPPTPPSMMPPLEESRFKPMGAACEDVDKYHPGGFHPVDLGDVLLGRYRVLRKLGYGSFSTVWLAEEGRSSAYIALKIYGAGVDSSRELAVLDRLATHAGTDPDALFVLLPASTFTLYGPNGRHLCLAFRPLGPSLADILNAPVTGNYRRGQPQPRRISTPQIRRYLRNVLCGLRFLHRHGVVHGDLQQGNVLLALGDLSDVDPSTLEQKNDKDFRQYPVVRRDGAADRWAPKYLVEPRPLTGSAAAVPLETQVATVADLGGAFFADAPPASIVTPAGFRAPELIFHGRAGPPMDVWSFGCLTFALLTNTALIDLFLVGPRRDVVDDTHLIQLVETIGPLSDGLRAQWLRYGLCFGPGGERLNADPEQSDDPSEDDLPVESWPPLEEKFATGKASDVGDAEAAQIVALLRDIFQYDPAKRPTADELLSRPWFQE